MAQADWTALTGILTTGDVARGVTSIPSKPTGGGTFVYAMNSLTNTPGSVAFHNNQASFVPMAKGGIISGAICRGASGGEDDWSAYLFIGLQGGAITDIGYILGLSDGDPCHIELRKGQLSGGLPDEPTGGANVILRQSTETVEVGTWVHLRLEMVVNDNGDTILNVSRNTGDVTAPVWAAIPGMAAFSDDALGIASGSASLQSGRAGFGATFAAVTRRAFFDHIQVARQT